jgi:hypothetical protein
MLRLSARVSVVEATGRLGIAQQASSSHNAAAASQLPQPRTTQLRRSEQQAPFCLNFNLGEHVFVVFTNLSGRRQRAQHL